MVVTSQEELETSPVLAGSELDELRWSVVSFSQMEAERLTYSQAVEFMAKLDSTGVAGLCIVTDEAAARIGRQNSSSLKA